MWTVQSCWVVCFRGERDFCLRKDWLYCDLSCIPSPPSPESGQPKSGHVNPSLRAEADFPIPRANFIPFLWGNLLSPLWRTFFFFIRCPHGSLLHHILVCAKPSHQETFLADQNQHYITPYFLILLYFSSQHLPAWKVVCLFLSSFMYFGSSHGNVSLRRTGALVCFVHCSVFWVWRVVGHQYLLKGVGPNPLPLVSLALWASQIVPLTVHHFSLVPPPEILFTFQGSAHMPPFV